MPLILDLFSGIGGISLGLEATGYFHTAAFCEIDPFCREVLKKHWPGVPVFDDVTKLTSADVGPVDMIAGGFPCQDVSCAGKGAGLDGKRSGLWKEFYRLICEIRPRYVLVENVGMLVSRGLDRVLADFAEVGMDAEWYVIPACSVGAPHRRERIWIVAYPNGFGCDQSPLGYNSLRQLECNPKKAFRLSGPPEPPLCGVDDGIPDRVDRNRALGNSVVPQVVYQIGLALAECMTATGDMPLFEAAPCP